MKGTVIADIHTHCGGPVCFNRPYRIRHTVSRVDDRWVLECSRCFQTRPANWLDLQHAADRVEDLGLMNRGLEVPTRYTATASPVGAEHAEMEPVGRALQAVR